MAGHANSLSQAVPECHSDSDEEILQDDGEHSLVIYATPEGRSVYPRDRIPRDVYESRQIFVLFGSEVTDDLPFQHGTPLLPEEGSSTELVTPSSSDSVEPNRQVFMAGAAAAGDVDNDPRYAFELLADISEDELPPAGESTAAALDREVRNNKRGQ